MTRWQTFKRRAGVTFGYIDRNLGTLGALVVTIGSELAGIAGIFPDRWAGLVSTVAIGAGLLGRGMSHLGAVAAQLQMGQQTGQQVAVQVNAAPVDGTGLPADGGATAPATTWTPTIPE